MTRPVAAVLVALCLVATGTSAAAQDGPGLYLHVIPVTTPDGVPGPDGPLHLRLRVEDPQEAVDAVARAVRLEDGWLVFELPVRDLDDELARPEDPAGRLAATFVIDYDEPPVVALTQELLAAHPRPTVDDLVAFTDRAIPDKTSRPYDFPSRVARTGTGDCTEHALLLAALARSVGRPARVVEGLVLAWEDGEVGAFGHAWAEIHDGTRWRRADATGVEHQAPMRYLPLAVLEDEGHGYSVRRSRQVRHHPHAVEVRPSTNPKDP